MHYSLNNNEDGSQSFTLFTGKVLTLQSRTDAIVSGTTTETVFSGKVLDISTKTLKTVSAKIVLPNGRHKEFDTDGVEMQEGDDVEFVVTGSGKNVFVRNLTSGVEDVAAPVYHRSGFVNLVALGLLGCVIYGLYKIFSRQHEYAMGLVWVFAAGSVLVYSSLKLQRGIESLEAGFRGKLLATGVRIKNFKPVTVDKQ